MTRYATRKSRIRAYQAANPGTSYSVAARRIDAANTANLLTGLRSTPMVALATALNAAGEATFAADLAHDIAAKQKPDPEAERLARAANDAYDAMVNAPNTLPAAARRHLAQAYDDADNARYYHSATDPYRSELAVVFAAFTALRCATTLVGDPTALARAAANVLATLRFDFTADAIRGHREEFEPIPTATTDNPAARYAQAAAETIAAATAIEVHRDEEWQECIRLLEQALQLANAAADVD